MNRRNTQKLEHRELCSLLMLMVVTPYTLDNLCVASTF